MITTYFKRLSIVVLGTLAISCNTDTKKTTIEPETTTTTVPTTTSSTQTPLTTTGVTEYTSKQTKADKKKYYNKNNNVVYEIKYKSDGFKLRTASSNLLWKIKLYDTKIKLSDNEENENPYEIKIVNVHEAKLVRGDIKIARTTYNLNSQIQTVKYEDNSRSSVSAKVPYSYSNALVKAISEIPSDQQQIIISELKAKGY
jgi:predicted transcriptional regulator